MEKDYKTYIGKFKNANVLYCVDESRINVSEFIDMEQEIFFQNILKQRRLFMNLDLKSLGIVFHSYN